MARGVLQMVGMATHTQQLLVVDDDPAILEVVAQVLSEDGYTVLTAGNGRRAVELANQYLPKLILLDLMMPEMNGWQVADALRDSARTRSIPILLLSARRDMDKTAAELGVAACLAKPFDLDELLGRVQSVLTLAPSQRPAPTP